MQTQICYPRSPDRDLYNSDHGHLFLIYSYLHMLMFQKLRGTYGRGRNAWSQVGSAVIVDDPASCPSSRLIWSPSQ